MSISHANPATPIEKRAWAEQINRYGLDAVLAAYRPGPVKRVDVALRSLLDLIDMDEVTYRSGAERLKIHE